MTWAVSTFYSLVAYAYFLAARHPFDFEAVQNFWSSRFRRTHMAKLHFDADRYDFLKELQERYRRHLAHARIRTP
jgi:hypothetical protein